MKKGRMNHKLNNWGFTLVELIIVIAILGLLAAIAVPYFNGLMQKTKATVCYRNKQAVIRTYTLNKITEPECTLPDFLNGQSDISVKNIKCPSGGVYIAEPATGIEEYRLKCSVHDGANGGNPVQNLIPGTNVAVNSKWPEKEDFFDTNGDKKVVYMYKGETFIYEGEYYVVGEEYVDLFWNEEMPTPTSGGWWASGLNAAFVKITDRIIEWEGGDSLSFNEKYRDNMPQKGDMVYWNGSYYVFTLNNQYWVVPPNVNLKNWVLLR